MDGRSRHPHTRRQPQPIRLGRSAEAIVSDGHGGPERTIAIDADGHVMEPAGVWVDRMDRRKWGDLIPHYVAEDSDGKDSWYVGGVRRAAGSAIFGCSAGMDPDELLARNWKYTEGHEAAWDGAARVRVLDEEDIAATVLYPSLTLTLGPLDPI